jgi:hypothetical protein
MYASHPHPTLSQRKRANVSRFAPSTHEKRMKRALGALTFDKVLISYANG